MLSSQILAFRMCEVVLVVTLWCKVCVVLQFIWVSNVSFSLLRFKEIYKIMIQSTKWYMKWIIYWTTDMKSSNAMILAVMVAVLEIALISLKIQDFNGVWTRDLAILVQHSNQLSYEATDVGSCSFVNSNFPMRNESINKMIHGSMNHILNCRYEIK